jgi:putative ABC transport system ATP-binding protein
MRKKRVGVPTLFVWVQTMTKQDNTAALCVNVNAFAYANGKPISLPSFELRPSEIVVLSGRSGSGKSTLLNLVSGVLALARLQGSIRVDDLELAGLAQATRDRLRPHTIGWVPQRVHLISALNVFANVMLPISFGHASDSATADSLSAKSDFSARALALMREAEIDALEHALPAQISVGQASRACVVRALVARPRVLCADEPSAALDRNSSAAIARLFARYAHEGGAALIASHDAAFTASLEYESQNVRTLSLEAP